MPKNTMPEMYEEQTEGVEQPSQEQILMSESELLRGLIEAGTEKDSEAAYERIQIRRNGKLKFEFRIILCAFHRDRVRLFVRILYGKQRIFGFENGDRDGKLGGGKLLSAVVALVVLGGVSIAFGEIV